MVSLEYILKPIAVSDFIENYYTKRGVYIRGEGKIFSEIYSYNKLNNLLNFSPVPHPTLKLVKDAKPIIIKNTDDILFAIKNGASLIIDQLHRYDNNVGLLTKEISFSLNEPTQVNLYLSQPNIKGFDLHYDTHDVFIIQIEGHKNWKVFEATFEFPLFDMKTHGHSPPENPYIDVILSPGDILYIPRGHWHVAIATEQASLHLTLGINSRTGIDFLNWLKDEMSDYSLWREAFPYVDINENNQNDKLLHFENLKKTL